MPTRGLQPSLSGSWELLIFGKYFSTRGRPAFRPACGEWTPCGLPAVLRWPGQATQRSASPQRPVAAPHAAPSPLGSSWPRPVGWVSGKGQTPSPGRTACHCPGGHQVAVSDCPRWLRGGDLGLRKPVAGQVLQCLCCPCP